ncbi:unnamed protein product [Adineta ricciae]|uniref:Uncharacterized protein n=1 Tax=Adineta ricciae TaxID=249248 RepID=A0A814T6Q2_ADIRI|nr:unnamed protein product [Adineta ricciae]
MEIKHNKWKSNGTTIAGGNGCGRNSNQLNYPRGFYVDSDKSLYIVDWGNHRIVHWKHEAKSCQVVAGGNGRGNRNNQLNYPRDVLLDKGNHSLIISDRKNQRIVRWFHHSKTDQEILISDIDCWGITMDRKGYIYAAICENNEVKYWKDKDKDGKLVAGGNKEGDALNQLHGPTCVFVDENYTLYVADYNNHRVMKWVRDAEEGIVVAGGNGKGKSLKQLSCPEGVTVDQLGRVYVVDCANHRVMRWTEGKDEGEIVVGGNGQGNGSNQLNFPTDLAFDDAGNLYVVDCDNHRIQKYEPDD